MDIRIGKTGRSCSACERSFQHEETLNSLVRFENQALEREDYCKDCWNSERGDGSFSTWTVTYIDPEIEAQEPEEVFSPLRQLFYDAVESEDRNTLAMAYLAAQLLRRQKVFRLIKETDEADGEINVALFSDRIGGGLIEVKDPHLSGDEMEEGRRALLKGLRELEEGEATDGDSDEDAESEEGGEEESTETDDNHEDLENSHDGREKEVASEI